MDREELEKQREWYRQARERHGTSAGALGYLKPNRQRVCFEALCADVLARPDSSVLDVGCGYGDLHGFLTGRGWRGRYTGVDVVEQNLEIARERCPGAEFRLLDITGDAPPAERWDFVIAVGVFHMRLTEGDHRAQIACALERMHALSRNAVAVNFMSSYVDYRSPEARYTEPEWAFAQAKKLSRRVQLRHDFMPYEFALIVYRDEEITDQRVFRAFEEAVGSGEPSG